MDIDAIKAETVKIRQSCDIIDNLLVPTDIIHVGLGDNLASIIEQAPPSSVISIVPAYQTDADLILEKPVTLISDNPIPNRASPLNEYPTINGILTNNAIANIINLKIKGKIKESTLIDSGDNLHLESCIIMGSTAGQHRGILANASNLTFIKCYIAGIIDSIDTQAIAAWDGCKNLLVDDCYLEASGENILFGGADAINEGMLPQDIVISNCDIVKLLEWKTTPSITVKNLFEVKAGKRIKVSNTRMKNSWTSGQDGFGILLTVRNQDGSAPFSTIEDITIENCNLDNLGAGIQILGQDYSHPSGILKNVTIKGTKFTNINGANGSGRQVFISRGSQNLSIDTCEFYGDKLNSAFNFDDPTILNKNLSVTGSLFQEGDFGIFGTGAPALGEPALAMYAPHYNWKDITIKKGDSGRTIVYPVGTTVVT
jgi:hypothetical protein